MTIHDIAEATGERYAVEASELQIAPVCNLIVKQANGTECLKWHSASDRSLRPKCEYWEENGKTTQNAEIVLVAVKNAINCMPYRFAVFDLRTDKWLEVTATFHGVFLQDIREEVTHWTELPSLQKEGG